MQLYFSAKITRLDLTMDVYDFPRNLHPYKANLIESSIPMNKEGTEIESYILGSKGGKCRITIYNKNTELGIESNDYYIRTEIVLRNLNCSLAELNNSLMDEFKKIRFFCNEFMSNPQFSDSFLASVTKEGLTKALINVSRNDRVRYLRYLIDYEDYPLLAHKSRFDYTHYKAFKPWVHPNFLDKDLLKKYKSLLKAVIYPIT
jgi:DNA relaxase NicK